MPTSGASHFQNAAQKFFESVCWKDCKARIASDASWNLFSYQKILTQFYSLTEGRASELPQTKGIMDLSNLT